MPPASSAAARKPHVERAGSRARHLDLTGALFERSGPSSAGGTCGHGRESTAALAGHRLELFAESSWSSCRHSSWALPFGRRSICATTAHIAHDAPDKSRLLGRYRSAAMDVAVEPEVVHVRPWWAPRRSSPSSASSSARTWPTPCGRAGSTQPGGAAGPVLPSALPRPVRAPAGSRRAVVRRHRHRAHGRGVRRLPPVGRAYREQALSWFTRYLGVTQERSTSIDRGFDKAEVGLIPFFVGSNIVAVLTGVHRTPPPKLAVLLAHRHRRPAGADLVAGQDVRGATCSTSSGSSSATSGGRSASRRSGWSC